MERRLKDAKDCNGDIIYMPEDEDIIQTIVKTLNETRQLIWDKGSFFCVFCKIIIQYFYNSLGIKSIEKHQKAYAAQYNKKNKVYKSCVSNFFLH